MSDKNFDYDIGNFTNGFIGERSKQCECHICVRWGKLQEIKEKRCTMTKENAKKMIEIVLSMASSKMDPKEVHVQLINEIIDSMSEEKTVYVPYYYPSNPIQPTYSQHPWYQDKFIYSGKTLLRCGACGEHHDINDACKPKGSTY